MSTNPNQNISEAFSSMLRTDYIALDDPERLSLLQFYFVDTFGTLEQILRQNDQLIVGRRGTGKTTLLYRAYVECLESWKANYDQKLVKPRTLGIYIDLSKCASIEDSADYPDFEHAFVSELCDATHEQLNRFWPELSKKPGLLERFFAADSLTQRAGTNGALQELSELLLKGVPRVSKESERKVEDYDAQKVKRSATLNGVLSGEKAELTPKLQREAEAENSRRTSTTLHNESRLVISDILRALTSLRANAQLEAIYIFVDEFSSLTSDMQRRFSTLLRKLLGTHAGIFIKLCAITDKYTLGSTIILQRDLFELSLDLDAYLERNQGLPQAMESLKEQARLLVEKRLAAYGCPLVDEVFQESSESFELLSRSGMGVPRTIGIVLQQAWQNCGLHENRIKKTDIEYGIHYASKAYLNQMAGATKDGVALPAHVSELWGALLERANQERAKEKKPASHFLVLPKNEEALKYLNMFFLVHLLTKGRTTKKDSSSRSLYCFDYGVCLENNLDYTTDKNVIRQQRFAYDDVVEPFMKFYSRDAEAKFQCPACQKIYDESELKLGGGGTLTFCPHDKADLKPLTPSPRTEEFTEEEIKIIGAIRSASKGDNLRARRIADDVGCYVQKVAKFGEKLENENIAAREKDESVDKYIYFSLNSLENEREQGRSAVT